MLTDMAIRMCSYSFGRTSGMSLTKAQFSWEVPDIHFSIDYLWRLKDLGYGCYVSIHASQVIRPMICSCIMYHMTLAWNIHGIWTSCSSLACIYSHSNHMNHAPYFEAEMCSKSSSFSLTPQTPTLSDYQRTSPGAISRSIIYTDVCI